jgi:hypothetical protein
MVTKSQTVSDKKTKINHFESLLTVHDMGCRFYALICKHHRVSILKKVGQIIYTFLHQLHFYLIALAVYDYCVIFGSLFKY